jgi:transposase-like protein
VAKEPVTKNKSAVSNSLTVATEKRPVGRPRIEFKPEYCDLVETEMASGFSFEACAGAIGICKQTLYSWVDQYPEFLDAKRRGTELNRRFWEKLGVDHIINVSESVREGKDQITTSKSLNSAVWIFNMKNRFRDEWRDKQEVDHSVKNGEKPPMALSYAIPEREVQEVEGEEHDS